jgi:hypothetical protein
MIRQEAIDQLTQLLSAIPMFSGVLTWDEIPAEYAQNALYLKDTQEKYSKRNGYYVATLRIEIVAVVIETSTSTADKLGNLALSELIKAVELLSVKNAFVTLAESHKWVTTKGKTACEIELSLDLEYKL